MCEQTTGWVHLVHFHNSTPVQILRRQVLCLTPHGDPNGTTILLTSGVEVTVQGSVYDVQRAIDWGVQRP